MQREEYHKEERSVLTTGHKMEYKDFVPGDCNLVSEKDVCVCVGGWGITESCLPHVDQLLCNFSECCL